MAAILKKSRLIDVSLQPFDRFWWNLARWRISAPYSGSTVKFEFFKNQECGGSHHEDKKNRIISTNGLTDLYEIGYNGCLNRPDS